MQRPRRKSLSRGSYAEVDEDGRAMFLESIRDESDEDTDDYSVDSDDEFVVDKPRLEVDRCAIILCFLL